MCGVSQQEIPIDTNILVYAEIVGVDPRVHPYSSFKARRKIGVGPKALQKAGDGIAGRTIVVKGMPANGWSLLVNVNDRRNRDRDAGSKAVTSSPREKPRLGKNGPTARSKAGYRLALTATRWPPSAVRGRDTPAARSFDSTCGGR